jgi:hypothetical protein
MGGIKSPAANELAAEQCGASWLNELVVATKHGNEIGI